MQLILDALSIFEKKEFIFKDQDEKLATYAKKISKKSPKIDWNIPAKKLIAKINGLSPYPEFWFKHNGKRIKIIEAEISTIKVKERSLQMIL